MSTDIQISDLTNGQVVNGAWSGDGIFDKLLSAVNDNIELQYSKGRIKGTDYANVYLGSMQAVLQESLQFLLQEKVVEAQVDNALKDLDIKSIQEQKEQFNLDYILPQQLLLTYAERVIKDKEAASLGMDNVIAVNSDKRSNNENYVYSPFYTIPIS